MAKFMVLYLSPVSAEQQMNVSPEEAKKGMEPWLKWMDKMGKALVDGGSPLGKGARVAKSGGSKTTTQVSGYSVLQADSIEAAKKMLTDHPHLMMPGSSIEVFEYLSMPGM
jgi:hypothetical protein